MSATEAYLPRPAAERRGVALCLSGGGYRAALFHLGVLRRLNELGTLARVDTVSSVSGGSILAGFLADRVREWPSSGPIAGFDEGVVRDVRDFTRKNIRTLWFGRRLLPWNWADQQVAVETLERRYEKDVVQLRLGQLPGRPRYVFCATELTFGTNWVMERTRVGSYKAGYVEPAPDWPVARAVAASSCFPPVFEPMPVGLAADQFAGGDTDAEDRDSVIVGLRLTDGGVYDNMALEPVWKSHAVVLVSDGGATFDRQGPAPLWRPFKGLGRYLQVQGGQAASVRRRWLVASFIRKEMKGVYFGIGSDVEQFVPGAPGYEPKLVDEVISEVRTDLDHFSDAEAAVLQNHGYLLADAAMRAYGAECVDEGARAPRPPYPNWMDAERVRQALRRSDKRAKPAGRWRAVEGTKDRVRRGIEPIRRLLPGL